MRRMVALTLNELREFLRREGGIGTMPTLAMRVMRMVDDPSSSGKDLERVISLDPVIMGEILKLANSALYSPKFPITSLRLAISYLGLEVVKNLVMMISLKSMVLGEEDPEVEAFLKQLWIHSAAAAIVSRFIANSSPLMESEEAFLIGLFHDVGKLLLLKFSPGEYMPIVRRVGSGEGGFTELEQGEFGLDHALAGAAVMETWEMPDNLLNIVKQHHTQSEHPMIACIALANLFCSTWGYSATPLELELMNFPWAAQVLSLEPDQWEEMSRQAKERIDEAAEILDI